MEYPKQEIKKRIISIAGTTAIKKKDTDEIIGLNLIEERGEKEVRYALWFTRAAKEANKDEIQGNRYPSAASIAFKEQQMTVGSKVGIAYVEEKYKYDYEVEHGADKGKIKQGDGVNSTIRWFSTPANIEEFDEESYGEGVQPEPTQPKAIEIPDTAVIPTEEDTNSIPF